MDILGSPIYIEVEKLNYNNEWETIVMKAPHLLYAARWMYHANRLTGFYRIKSDEIKERISRLVSEAPEHIPENSFPPFIADFRRELEGYPVCYEDWEWVDGEGFVQNSGNQWGQLTYDQVQNLMDEPLRITLDNTVAWEVNAMQTQQFFRNYDNFDRTNL